MRVLNLISSAMIFVICFSNCKHATITDSLTAAPKDASSVSVINLNNISKKADWATIQGMDFYKDALANTTKESPAMAEFLKDPKKSGVDFTKNIYLLQDISAGIGSQNGVNMTILMSMGDIKAFEAMLQNAKAGEVSQKTGYKQLAKSGAGGKEGGAIGWNEKIIVVLAGGEDTDLAAYFNRKSDESMASNPEIAKMMTEPHDMYSLLSTDGLANNIGAKAGAGVMGIDPKALLGNYVTGFSDFQQGEMTGKMLFNFKKELTKDFSIMFKDHVKTDFSKYMAAQQPVFAMSMALDMKGLKEIIKSNASMNTYAKQMESAGFTLDELTGALDGDAMVVVAPDDKGSFGGTLGFKVGNKVNLMKFINMAVQYQKLVPAGVDAYTLPNQPISGKLIFHNDMVFIGDDASLAKIKSGATVASTANTKNLTNNIVGMFINFDKILSAIPASTMKGFDAKAIPFADMQMTINGKGGESSLKMKDPKENSLIGMLKMINAIYMQAKNNPELNFNNKGLDDKGIL
jgi:hypothetical protein